MRALNEINSHLNGQLYTLLSNMNNQSVCVAGVHRLSQSGGKSELGNAPQSWILKSYRPRGSLARALYEKQMSDNYLDAFDKSLWYQCDLRQLPQDIAESFVQMHPDSDTLSFLQKAEDKSDWILTQIWHSLAKAFLGWFMTQTSINGWLRRGSMFVLSLSQFLKLMNRNEAWRGVSLLDLGAGDGEVTACIAPLFNNVFVTEVSQTMQMLLQKRGYELLEIDKWHSARKYEVISCLNVLDRCDRPLLLLHQIKEALEYGGRALIAVVLPFSPYVETGTITHSPKSLAFSIILVPDRY
uniref:Methyltransferase-like protein 9 n=1 Tax=Photinus pyralis TaxID=7054 RepID=A0A1Y1KNU0_PHOPY